MNSNNINEIKLKIVTELSKIEKAKIVVNKMREENYDPEKIKAHLTKINDREKNLLNQQREIEEFEIREMKRVQEEKFKNINDDLMIQKTQREKEVLDLSSKVENSRFTLDKMRQEKESLANQISNLIENKQKVEDEFESFKIKSDNSRKESEDTKNRLESVKKEIESDVFELESKKNSLESAIAIKKHDLLELRDEILGEERKLTELKASNKSTMENELSSLFSEDTVSLETSSIDLNTSDLFTNAAMKSNDESQYTSDNLDSSLDVQKDAEKKSFSDPEKDEATVEATNEINKVSNEENNLENEDLFADSKESTLELQVAQAVAEVENSDDSSSDLSSDEQNDDVDQLKKIEQESTKMLEMLKLSNQKDEEESINEKTAILSGADNDKVDSLNSDNLTTEEEKGGIGFFIIVILIILVIAFIMYKFIFNGGF
jgi:hypothetical protein